MTARRFSARVRILAAAIPLLAACAATPAAGLDPRTAPQSASPTNPEPQPATLDAKDAAFYRAVFKRYADIAPVLDRMAESGNDGRLTRDVDALRERPGATSEIARLYTDLTRASRKNPSAFSEARWRSVYLLAELRQKDALRPLASIASAALPKAGRDELLYATEFRLRARAIIGLQNLGSIEELERLYSAGGPLRGVAAAALYDLGKPPRGVKQVDARQTFGEASSIDVHPKERAMDPTLLRLPATPEQGRLEPIVPETSKTR